MSDLGEWEKAAVYYAAWHLDRGLGVPEVRAKLFAKYSEMTAEASERIIDYAHQGIERVLTGGMVDESTHLSELSASGEQPDKSVTVRVLVTQRLANGDVREGSVAGEFGWEASLDDVYAYAREQAEKWTGESADRMGLQVVSTETRLISSIVFGGMSHHG